MSKSVPAHEAQRIELATRENVHASLRGLRATSSLLSKREETGKLLIVGAEYSLTSGDVDFFEGANRAATRMVV